MKLKFGIIAATLLLLGGFFVGDTNAQSGSSGGISISPPLMEIDINSGDEKIVSFDIRNVSDTAQEVSVSFRDFEPGISGDPNIIEGDKAQYGLKSWFEPVPSFVLERGETKTVPLAVTASSIGYEQTYYGAVLFSFESLQNDGTEQKTSVASMIFANIGTPSFAGEVTDLTVTDSDTTIPEKSSGKFSLTVENTGYYKFTPTVTLELVEEDGFVIKTLQPDSEGAILPQSERLFEFNFSGILDSTKNYLVRARALLPDGSVMSGQAEQTFYQVPVVEEEDTKEDKEEKTRLFIAIGISSGLAFILLLVVLFKTRKRRQKVEEKPAPEPTKETENQTAPVQPQPEAETERPAPQIVAPQEPVAQSTEQGAESTAPKEQ